MSGGQRGTELAYAENTSSVTGIAAAGGDVTGLTITFTVGDRPVVVEVVLPLVGQVTSAAQPTFYIADASNNLKSRSAAGASIAAGGGAAIAPIKERIPANTGSVTRKVRATSSAGTVSVFASTAAADTYKPFIRAYEV